MELVRWFQIEHKIFLLKQNQLMTKQQLSASISTSGSFLFSTGHKDWATKVSALCSFV